MTYQPVRTVFQVATPVDVAAKITVRHLGSRTIEWVIGKLTKALAKQLRRHRERRWRAAWRNLSPHQLRDLGLQPANVVWLVDAPHRANHRTESLLRAA